MGIAAIGAGVLGATSLIGGAIEGNASQSAANTQANADKSAQQTELSMFNQTQQNLQPWMTTGQSALSQLASLYGVGPGGNGTPNTAAMTTALENTPGYQFQLGQGETALNQTLASQGLELSGAQLTAAQQYGQGLAQSTAWQPYINTLTGLSNSGLSAGNSLGSFGANMANNVSQLQVAAGQAQASGTVGAANALTSSLQGGLGSSLLGYNILGGSSYGQGQSLLNAMTQPNGQPSGLGVDSGTPILSGQNPAQNVVPTNPSLSLLSLPV